MTERDMVLNPSEIYSVEQLEQWMKTWRFEPKDRRKLADDESIRLYGKSVLSVYDDLRAAMLANHDGPVDPNSVNEPDNTISTNNVSVEESAIIEPSINNIDDPYKWEESIIRARIAEQDGFIIIIDTSEPVQQISQYTLDTLEKLEQKWDSLQSMSSDRRVESGQKAFNIFGMDNNNLYSSLKNYIMNKAEEEAIGFGDNQDVEDIDYRSTIDADYDDLLFSEIRSYLVADDMKRAKSFNEIASLYDADAMASKRVEEESAITHPFFSPEEMRWLGVFSGEDGNMYGESTNLQFDTGHGMIPLEEWYKNYCDFGTVTNPTAYTRLLQELYLDYQNVLESGNKEAIAKKKQMILELGWNPEVTWFDPSDTRVVRATNSNDDCQKNVIDLSDEYCNYNGTKTPPNPLGNDIFITSEIGDNLFSMSFQYLSNATFFFWKDAKDPEHPVRSWRGAYEDQSEHRKNMVLIAYVRLDDKTYKTLQDILYNHDPDQWDEINDIARRAFDLAGGDARKSLVYFHRGVFGQGPRCNIVYDGRKNLQRDIDPQILCAMVNDLVSDPIVDPDTPIPSLREACSDGDIHQLKLALQEAGLTKAVGYLTPTIVCSLNERVKGVDVDEKGNIIIKTVKDVNTEFFKCHRNLISYEKAGNYESMKDELCKLKYLDNFAVRKMKNRDGKNYKEYADAHARITNDFNKYLKMVTEHDPEFNFPQYYEQSQWYDGDVKISKQFVDWIIALFERILHKH